MKLGFLTAPFPETPLMEVADWAVAEGFEVLEIACWPRTGLTCWWSRRGRWRRRRAGWWFRGKFCRLRRRRG